MERVRLSIFKDDDDSNVDWFSFYRERYGTEDLAWDNSCFEKDSEIDLLCFRNDYNFGRRMLKRYK